MRKAYYQIRKQGLLSESELHKMHVKLNQAVVDGLIASNPCAAVSAPRPKPAKRKSLSAEEAARLNAVLAQSPRTAFEEINDAAMGRWKEAGEKTKTFKPLEIGPDTPVISNELGGFTDPNVFSRWFRGFCVEKGFGTYGKREAFIDAAGRKRIRKAKYEGLNFHELRHTQATLLIGSGADVKTVQTRFGHSSAQLTMNVYAHAIEANDRNAADAIGDILSERYF